MQNMDINDARTFIAVVEVAQSLEHLPGEVADAARAITTPGHTSPTDGVEQRFLAGHQAGGAEEHLGGGAGRGMRMPKFHYQPSI